MEQDKPSRVIEKAFEAGSIFDKNLKLSLLLKGIFIQASAFSVYYHAQHILHSEYSTYFNVSDPFIIVWLSSASLLAGTKLFYKGCKKIEALKIFGHLWEKKENSKDFPAQWKYHPVR